MLLEGKNAIVYEGGGGLGGQAGSIDVSFNLITRGDVQRIRWST